MSPGKTLVGCKQMGEHVLKQLQSVSNMATSAATSIPTKH